MDCETCSARVDAMSFLSPATSPDLDWDQLRTETEAELAGEQGLLGRLRGMRLIYHRLFVFSVASLLTLLVFSFLLRPDLSVYPGARMLLIIGGLTGTFAAGVILLTAPLYRRLEKPLHLWIWVTTGVIWAVGLAVLPQAHQAHPTANLGAAENFWVFAAGCFVFGNLLALPILGAIAVVVRNRMSALLRLCLLATTAALIGLLGLQIHCPITHPGHLFWGHSTVTLGLILLMAAGLGLRRLFSTRS